jgi:hypothetical protein
MTRRQTACKCESSAGRKEESSRKDGDTSHHGHHILVVLRIPADGDDKTMTSQLWESDCVYLLWGLENLKLKGDVEIFFIYSNFSEIVKFKLFKVSGGEIWIQDFFPLAEKV